MKTIILLATIGLTNIFLPAWAAEQSTMQDMSLTMNPNKVDREKMASAHEQMAACLRSDQEFKACHLALHKQCESMMGGSCPGMDMGNGKHKGMNH